MRPASFLGRAGRSAALLCFGLVLALFAFEVALRLAGNSSDQLLQQDPVLGVRFIPGKTGVSRHTCFSASASVNSHGWRSPETSWEKPEDVLRIVVLGDSFMGAIQVEDDETFAAALEGLLGGAGLARRVEVINLGVPSFGTDQEYLALREFGSRYAPDWVVLAFYAQNDVVNNSMLLERRFSAYPKPFFDVREGKLVEIPYRDPTPVWIRLARRGVRDLRLYPWIRARLLQIPLARRVLFELGIVGVLPRDDAGAAENLRYPTRWERQAGVFREPYDAEWEHAWEVTRALLSAARDEAARQGAGFLLLGLPDPLAVMPASVLAEVLPDGTNAELDLGVPARRLAELAASESLDFLPLGPAFRQRIGASEAAFAELFLACDGHWTVEGHRLAAERVARHLAPLLRSRLRP